ncbi:helicase [Acutalibacter muris]|nr:LPD25 domain-containing protein [Acutalibacter muris]ANU55451.2 helicase [Hungateiclostridiaceae bacterium KB18]ASB42751.1 helicase [Acutalibacter muris]
MESRTLETSNEESAAQRYQVVIYCSYKNGFDEKLEYRTLNEAQQTARQYISGEMEDGFQYEGAGVYDLQERQWLYAEGHFPVLEGDKELPYLPYKIEEKPALAEQTPTVRELYDKYKADIITALASDQPYRNACQNSNKDTAYLEGEAAIKRVVLAIGDDTLTKLYFDNTKFHNDLHRETLDKTYPLFSQQEQESQNKYKPQDVPYIFCEWSESDVFQNKTAYSLAEFDRLMKERDSTYVEKQAEGVKKYGTWQKMYDSDDPEYIPYLGYEKVKFTLVLPDGRTFTERQDIGDGDGGVVDFLSQYDKYREIIPLLGESLESVEPIEPEQNGPLATEQNTSAQPHELPVQKLPADTLTPDPVPQEPAPQDTAQPDNPQFTTKPVAIYRAEKNKLPFDVIIETIHVEEPQRGPAPQNFHITDDKLGAGGAKTKYQMNMAAIKALHDIEQENRPATPDEQETLSKYVGWGALADAFDESKPAWTSEYKELLESLTPEEYESARASTLNAHYTSPTVIKAMYQALENMGFHGGNILEPSCGVGNFFGLLPESMSGSKLYGAELDGLTGRIAQQLYPNAHIEIKGYESTSFQNNSFDLAIGNVPFGNYQVYDPAYNKLGFSIHNYFFAKTIDQVRPGGIIAFVTSRYTMDSKSTQAREYMAQRAELLGAVRLPNNAFLANAGTGVVTDLLFLQKRERPIADLPDWVYTEKNKDGFTINSYFIDHPEMILGEQSSESTQYAGQEFTVNPLPGADLGELLEEAITRIDGHYMEAETVQVEDEKQQETLPADPDVKNFTYTIVKGDVYYRQDSVMVKMELGATAKARTVALINLRDCTRRLISEQLDSCTPEESIRHTQEELNRLYDSFSKKFGLINNKINERTFSQDSSYYLLCALEILDDEGKFVRKSDMFTKRTIYPHQEITHVDTATEALAVSLGERARVDIPFMAELTGKAEEEIISGLQGQIYRVPLKEPPVYQTADEYLSGNVREKLKIAEAAASVDPAYQVNVSALEAVQPRDLDASEIAVRLGTDWMDPEYIGQFMHETLRTPSYARNEVHVQYSPIVHAWNISNKTHIRKDDVAAHSTYGTPRVSAYKLLEDALNLQNTRVYDTVEDAEGNEKRVLNAKETTLAQQKQAMIKLAFQDWIWRDPDRREKLVRKYNDEMNCIRPREYDGSHLVLAGMNPEIQLEEHQKNAIARAVYGGNTLFAHCVGAGKTFEMTASAMEMKRLGLCSKSMIVVPNHLTQQWASEFLRLYPNANILVTTKRDFEKDRRKKFCSRIATGDYDAVIIGYSQFEKIPISKERQLALLHQQIDSIVAGIALAKAENGQHFTVKNLERTKRSLEDRLKKLQADHRKDNVINFEELGIDRLFVDESDCFKNLFLATKMQNVAGLSTSDAQKSSDMFSKTRYLDEITDYKGVIFATGTPISNSIAEMFTVQRYLQYNALEAMHMEHFDSWASRFGETVTTMELAPEGTGYRPRERFAKFFNLPELMNIFHEVADIKTEDMLNLPTPDVEFHNIVAKPTEFQKDYVQELSERATAVRNGDVKPTEDNMLKITNDGRKLGLDQRLISPFAEDDPASKLNLCVENIMKFWEEGKEEKLTQLVFSDLSTPKKDGTFNVYDDIKRKLIERGVPENEVAFIHDAESEVKKKELFAKVRGGKVRVLIGSTQKLGAGTNIQDRLIALHHLDVPWRPRDLTQREGRIKRRGNQNEVVHAFRYVTEGTFDAYLYQTVEKKQQFIGQIMTSKSPARTCDDVDEAALSYAEVKALCAGDPRIKERMELDVDVAKLQVMQASHRSQQYNLEDKLRKYFPQEQQRLEWRIEGIQRDMATLAANPLPKDDYRIELLGQRFDERKAAGVVLLKECKNVKVYTTVPVGEYRGLKLFVKYQNLLSNVQIVLKGAVEYAFDASDSDIGNIVRLDNALERLPEELSKAQASLENVKQQMESAKSEVGRPFSQEQELKDKLARIVKLEVALKMEHNPPETMHRETAPAQRISETVAL